MREEEGFGGGEQISISLPLGQTGSEVPGFHRALSCGVWGHGVPACTLMALCAHQMCQHQLRQSRCDLLLTEGLAPQTQPGKLLA